MSKSDLPSFDDNTKMRASWTAGAGYYDTLIDLKRAIMGFFIQKDADGVLWGVKCELMLVEPFLRKQNDKIIEIEALLYQAEEIIYRDDKNFKTKSLNYSLALKKMYEAERKLNYLEGVNKMLQPVGSSINEKMRAYGT